MTGSPEYPPGITRWTRWIVRVDVPGPTGYRERSALRLLLGLTRLAFSASFGFAKRWAWLELNRTVASFRFFRLGSQLLGARGRKPPLSSLVDGLRRKGLYSSLWAVEGVGYERAEERGASSTVLGGGVTAALPAGSLVPLNVGAGLALARAGVSGDRLRQGAHRVISRLLEEIELSSSSGCAGVGVEAIGLHTRTLLPSYLPAVDDALRRQAAETRAWFWHGVGRAQYFLFPRALFGGPGWPGWARVAAEAPDEDALRPAQAGFVWALCLVNTGEPAVIEAFLRQYGGELDQEVFEHGLVGTALVWHAWAGMDPRLRRLLDHRPGTTGLRWDDRVRQPVQRGLKNVAPALEQDRRFERLFLFPSEPPGSSKVPHPTLSPEGRGRHLPPLPG